MIPHHAVVKDRDGDLWTCPDEAEGRWFCATQTDTHGCTESELVAELAPLDVLVHRGRIEPKDKQ